MALVPLALAQTVEQATSLGIFVLAMLLATLSGMAWRRERDRRMLVVGGAYLLFGLYGLIAFLEYFLLPYLGAWVELLEHGAAVLILGGLLAFFYAITSDR